MDYIFLGILSTEGLNSGLGINMDASQDPNSSYDEKSNCDANLPNGDTICGSLQMACQEISSNGTIECSSFCSGKLSKINFPYFYDSTLYYILQGPLQGCF